MKRSWIGAGLLAALLLFGILSSRWMGGNHSSIARDVEQAALAALREDWGQALRLTEQAKQDWEQNWGISAALADHSPMEQVNTLFAQLEPYAAAREAVAFAGVCAQLATEIQAIGEAHSFTWWNLL